MGSFHIRQSGEVDVQYPTKLVGNAQVTLSAPNSKGYHAIATSMNRMGGWFTFHRYERGGVNMINRNHPLLLRWLHSAWQGPNEHFWEGLELIHFP